MMVGIGSLQLAETELSKKHGIAVFNSSSPWASSADDLKGLYACPFTAAVTTRTAVITQKDIENLKATGERQEAFQSTFEEDKRIHSHSFLRDPLKTIEGGRLTVARGSLNSYGYSPHSLSSYLGWVSEIIKSEGQEKKKPIILSITGSADIVESTIIYLRRWVADNAGAEAGFSPLIGVEINLSCPNIKGKEAPSGYDGSSISGFVAAAQRGNMAEEGGPCQLSIGLKLPPYTYQAQFRSLISALSSASQSGSSTSSHPIAFLTSTNTLGSSFWLNEGEGGEMVKALPSTVKPDGDDYDGTGGLAGESLHPISLGNVFKIFNLLRTAADSRLHSINIIGVGGVMSGLSAQRMRSAGSNAVALATALGREGIDVFERISNELLDEIPLESDDED